MRIEQNMIEGHTVFRGFLPDHITIAKRDRRGQHLIFAKHQFGL